MLRLAQHQIALERVVQRLRRLRVIHQTGAQAHRQGRQQGGVELTQIARPHLLAQRLSLEQSHAQRPRRAGVILLRHLHHRLRRIGLLQGARDVLGHAGGGMGIGHCRPRLQCSTYLLQVRTVAQVAEPQPGQRGAGQQRHTRVRGGLQPRPAALLGGRSIGQAGFAQHHLAQQPLDEEGAALRARCLHARFFQAEGARHRAHHAVDRRAVLGAGGEVHPAQQRCRAIRIAGERAFDKLPCTLAKSGNLLRKRQDRRTPQTVALQVQAFEQARAQLLLQHAELVGELARRVPVQGLRQRKCHAPHLVALRRRQIVEELAEAADQIALGEDQIHRHAGLQLLGQLVQAAADRLHMRVALGIVEQQQVRHAHRHQHAVERAAWAIASQQAQEIAPRPGIHRLIRILRGVAPGGVQEHRFVGEPPFAIAGAADAAQRRIAHARSQRKLQARMLQQGALARTGRADQRIPRQRIQIGAAAPLA